MSVVSTSIRTAWEMVYRVSPIILTGGVASALSSSFSTKSFMGSALSTISSAGIPLALLMDPLALLGEVDNLNIDNLFAHFMPIPGSTLIDNSYAQFPFANQTIAGNAQIQNPLHVSIVMECAYRGDFNMITRIATLSAMQAVIAQHCALGGRFTVITPAMIYTNALLLRVTDISANPTQPQTIFQWDFERPLITKQEAASASSTLMSKLSSGSSTSGSWISAASGNPVASLLADIF